MSSSKIPKDVQNLINDTNETIKESLREKKDAAQHKLGEIKETVSKGAEYISETKKELQKAAQRKAEEVNEQGYEKAKELRNYVEDNAKALADASYEKGKELRNKAEDFKEATYQKAKELRHQEEALKEVVSEKAKELRDEALEFSVTAQNKAADLKDASYQKAMEMRANIETKVEDFNDVARDKAAAAGEYVIDSYHEAVNTGGSKAAELLGYPQGKIDTIEQEAEGESKGLFEKIGEKLHDTKEYIADKARAGMEKVEHLGSAIKETVVGVKEKTEDELVQERARMHLAGEHIKEGVSDVYSDLTGKMKNLEDELSEKHIK
jgi:gas vesicle protein